MHIDWVFTKSPHTFSHGVHDAQGFIGGVRVVTIETKLYGAPLWDEWIVKTEFHVQFSDESKYDGWFTIPKSDKEAWYPHFEAALNKAEANFSAQLQKSVQLANALEV